MEPSKKISIRALSKPVTMKTPTDYTGWPARKKPTPPRLVTMELCKTCANTHKTSRGYVCLLTCKPCGVLENSKYEDCVNHKIEQ